MLFLGVDGGGSKTAALLATTAGQVRGWGIGPGSNYHLVGLERAGSNIKSATDAALSGRTANAACFCLAAADMPHDFVQLRSKMSELGLGCPFTVRNDVIGVFRAGSRFPFGVGIVCGSGFNAGGVGKDGREYRLPALGPITGDIAGARRLAMQAVGQRFERGMVVAIPRGFPTRSLRLWESLTSRKSRSGGCEVHCPTRRSITSRRSSLR